MGSHFLPQGIFLTQGSSPCLVSPALAGRFFTTVPSRKLMPQGDKTVNQYILLFVLWNFAKTSQCWVFLSSWEPHALLKITVNFSFEFHSWQGKTYKRSTNNIIFPPSPLYFGNFKHYICIRYYRIYTSWLSKVHEQINFQISKEKGKRKGKKK